MIRYRFQFLLFWLFSLILALPFLPMLGAWGRAGTSFFFSMLLLAAVAAVPHRRISGAIAIGLFVVTFLLQIVGLWFESDAFLITKHIADILFLGYVTSVILRHLFTTNRVSLSMISASLCVYLLLAVLWANAYSLIDIIDPTAFAYNAVAVDGEAHSMRFGGSRSVTPIYYSLVTITTLGYGDITPVSAAASMLSVVQAVIGQFYLTVLVAWLVGKHIASSINISGDN
jgi:Ion channel